MNHTCHANFCNIKTEPKLLMCKPHWKQLPNKLKNAVWLAFKGTTKESRIKSIPYLTACAEAVEFIAESENKAKDNTYRRIANRLKTRRKKERWII